MDNFAKRIEPVDHKEVFRVVNDQTKEYDTKLLVLKSHLVIEYLLNLSIEKLSKAKVDIDRIQFTQKLKITEILGLFIDDQELLDVIRAFNKVRNTLAHNLNFNKKDLDVLFKHYKPEMKPKTIEIPPPFEAVLPNLKLFYIIAFTCGKIAAILDHLIDINNAYAEVTTNDFKLKILTRKKDAPKLL